MINIILCGGKIIMPSKLLCIMASQKPSIVTDNTQSAVAKAFEVSKGGYFYDSDCFDDVITAIQELNTDHKKCLTMGNNARRYIIEHFSSSKVLENFEKKVQDIILS